MSQALRFQVITHLALIIIYSLKSMIFRFLGIESQPEVPFDSILDIPIFGILPEVPAIGFVEQRADQVLLVIADIICLLHMLDGIFKANTVYLEHRCLDDLSGKLLPADMICFLAGTDCPDDHLNDLVQFFHGDIAVRFLSP